MASRYVTASQFGRFHDEESRHHEAQDVRFANIESLLGELKLEQAKQHEFLFGNGKKGLDEIINGILEFIGILKEERETKAEEQRKQKVQYIFWGVTFALSTTVNMIIALFVLKGG